MHFQGRSDSQVDHGLQEFWGLPDTGSDQLDLPGFPTFTTGETLPPHADTQEDFNTYNQNDTGREYDPVGFDRFTLDGYDPAWVLAPGNQTQVNLQLASVQRETSLVTSVFADNTSNLGQYTPTTRIRDQSQVPEQTSLAIEEFAPTAEQIRSWNNTTLTGPLTRMSQSLPRRRSRYHIQRKGKDNTAVRTPLRMPYNRNNNLPQDFEPLLRWRNSPPEDEPGSLFAIGEAILSVEASASTQESALYQYSHTWDDTSHRARYQRPRSVASSLDSECSGSSLHSGTSIQSTRSAPTQRRSPKDSFTKRGRSRRAQDADEHETRSFHCTFCCDTFKRKYDWTRHEKSLHLDLEAWACTPYGGSVLSQPSNRVVCAYCNMLEPSAEHFEAHNHHACHGESAPTRTFRRKDHLVQHLRLVHRLDTLPVIDNWRTEPHPIQSRCGFCEFRMYTWEERQAHLAVHFRKGLTMRHWHGDHEFEPVVAAQVRNALPPYLLGSESQSVMPFSATSANTMDHYQQMVSHSRTNRDHGEALVPKGQSYNSTMDQSSQGLQVYIELLTSHLATFAQDCARRGIVPTDEMFQRESRKVHFNCDDPWEQTVADNSEWLAAFRQQQNLG